MLLIRDLERPFNGIVRIYPTDLTDVRDDIHADYLARYPESSLPCDTTGSAR